MPTIITQGALSAEGFGFSAPSGVTPVYIEDVFNTYLYTGNSGTQTVTTNLDLSTKGGLIWIKNRTNGQTGHALTDTARGPGTGTSSAATNILASNSTSGTGGGVPNGSDYLSAFTTTGFTVVSGGGANAATRIANRSADNYVAWTFEKQAKFFDVVTYTGNGVAGRTVSHNLGSVPGCIMIKRTDATSGWAVYHRSLANTEYLVLNTTAIKVTGATTYWNSTTPTSTVFTLGTATDVNASGGTYVAYLFAHNAGGFGLNGTDNVITCGSYVGTGTTNNTVTLGYEPQFLLFKTADTAVGNWFMIDTMRQFGIQQSTYVYANTTAGDASANSSVTPTATGFSVLATTNAYNQLGVTYVYIAIRRGPMKSPTSGTTVFSPISSGNATGTTQTTNFVIDSQWKSKNAGDTLNATVDDRLRTVSVTSTASGRYLTTSSATAEITTQDTTQFFNNTGFQNPTYYGGVNTIFWSFARAPSFFDTVLYTGTGSNTTQTHNLGVVPELIIIKRRNATGAWSAYSANLSNTEYLVLNTTAAKATGATYWNSTTPTSSVFSLGTAADVNASGGTYTSYLFASCPGVSKVGSYTGTGALQTINCGFTSGARFVLIKRTDTTGDWFVYDSARGISSGNDPYILFNTTAGEVTGTNYVDTDTTGFKVTAAAPAGLNANGGNYIFLAIA